MLKVRTRNIKTNQKAQIICAELVIYSNQAELIDIESIEGEADFDNFSISTNTVIISIPLSDIIDVKTA